MWLLVPLGNPGTAYCMTRHNLGRLMLMRWIKASFKHQPKVVRRLRFGDIVSLNSSLNALIPSTYMNLSGLAFAESVKVGYDPKRIVIIYDDKDLPLGSGRVKLTGSDGGHNGLRSIIECLRCRDIPRLRLGIGPFQRPLVEFVLGKWTESELNVISAMDDAFSCFMDLLQNTEDLNKLSSKVNTEVFWERQQPKRA